MKKIILFDLDGTLIDSTNAIYESFCEVFKKNNMPILDKKDVTKFIGHTLQDMFRFFNAKEDKIEQYCNEYKNHYIKICNKKTQMLPNAIESIKLAHSFATLGIVTTKTSRSSKELLAFFGVDKYFTTIIGREDVSHTKPDKEPIIKAINNIESSISHKIESSNYNDIFMIGDTILDLKAAKNTGIRGIGILCGYGIKKDLEKFSKHIFEDSLKAVNFIQML